VVCIPAGSDPASGSERANAGDHSPLVEAVKTVSDLYAPVGGEVVEVNGTLVSNPALVNQEPFGQGWMVRIKPDRPDGFSHRKITEAYIRTNGITWPVLDDTTYRSFETMADYRRWCESELPDWLGYGRV